MEKNIAVEAHERIAKEREEIMKRARLEVNAEWDEKEKAADIEKAKERQVHEDHMASRRRIEKELDEGWKNVSHFSKTDRVIDNLVGKEKRGRGRPPGSKNRPKAEVVGSIPDLIIPDRQQ